ncbi:uncharacterized protein LMH87_009171 [Akanthomyces muscarius]|uniref:Uncharacterized protein n=1 Tax=Akanthomyces muscarius TaxID=2231603 RepID=A0A9W8QL61_AKAMU|nr:uncharacterized protein LMH87_009171 [Akanthomyces muscarius]KAJ4158655.1 hypothetical protein LMH87_009171 [Akanthomyces muscarius]
MHIPKQDSLRKTLNHENLRRCHPRRAPRQQRPGRRRPTPSQFQELSLGAPQDVLAGDYINMWFRLNIDQFQAPHAAFSEDAWVVFHTYLKNHTGAVAGTDLSWWVVDLYMNTAKAGGYYHGNDTSVSHSRVFNAKSK